MKKVYQIIGSFGLSVVAVAAMAQSEGIGMAVRHLTNAAPSKRMITIHEKGYANNQQNRVGVLPMNVRIDYATADYVSNGYSQTSYAHWIPLMALNHNYKLADSGNMSSPSNCRANTLNSATVAFDSIWDIYTSQGYTAQAGSVVVDTLWATLTEVNTSAHNDTLIFWINKVNSKGFPSTIHISSDTFIITPTTFPAGATMDSSYVVNLPLRTPLMIPATERKGWNFSISLDYHDADKMDTLGVSASSPFFTCNGGDYSGPAGTSLGVPSGALYYSASPVVNSWMTGLYWDPYHFDAISNQQLTWPDTVTGTSPIKQVQGRNGLPNGGYLYFVPCGVDTPLSSEQDINIGVSLGFNNVTGVNEVKSNGLTVSQNYPNPFNQQTQIKYNLTNSSNVVFSVYDLTGRQLVNTSYNDQPAGDHYITLNANQLSPGIYFYSFIVNGNVITQKMIVTQ